MNRWWIAALAIVGVSTVARESQAQYWLQDRTLSEGRGIRVGDFELHPGVGLEAGYDSNVFYAAQSPTPAGILRVTPSFSVSTLGPQRSANTDAPPTAYPTVDFRGGIALIYDEFVPVQQPNTVSQLRNVGVQADVNFLLFPHQTWQFSIADEFTRTIQPGPELPEALGGGSASSQTFNRDYNHAATELIYAPGHSIFDLRVGFAFNALNFEDAPYTGFNYFQEQGSVRMRWRFLPKTAILWEGYITPLNYASGSIGNAGLFASTPVSTRIGINGLLTDKLGILVMVGYEATFFVAGDNLDTVIGQAEVRWIINPLSTFRLGYGRTIENSFYGNYYLRNRGYLNYTQSFSGRFLLAIDGGVSLLDYGYIATQTGLPLAGVVGADPTTGRFSAVRVEGTVFGEYRMNDVIGLNATLSAASNISDVALPVGATNLPISWTRFTAFLGARANW